VRNVIGRKKQAGERVKGWSLAAEPKQYSLMLSERE
jgi:hypothetical protein